MSLDEAFEEADLVATVRVVSARIVARSEVHDVLNAEGWSKARDTVEEVVGVGRVVKMHKGRAPRRFTLLSEPFPSLCFDRFDIGVEYLVFSTKKAVVSFSACGVHPEVSPAVVKAIERWRKSGS